MDIKRVAIDVGNASVGMYVAMLDRPWLETPFLFQGFEIRDQEEIDLLQRYCTVIHVDIERSTISPHELKRLVKLQETRRRSKKASGPKPVREENRWLLMLRRLLARIGLGTQATADAATGDEGYPILSTVRGEASEAQDAYTRLADHYAQLVDRARINGDVNMSALRRAVTPAVDSILRNPDAMAWTVFSRKRNAEEYLRAVGTAIWCVIFGRFLGLDRQQIEELAMGGLLLDIGNVRLPDSVTAAQGAMSDEKLFMMKQHVQHGLDILARSKAVPQTVIDMVGTHHERADGSGYPGGLQGSKIPPFGRIAGIADAYDAMTTLNAYSPALAAYDAARELNELRGRHFAAEVVEQFLRSMGMFPTASVVELSDGTVGVVLEQNRRNALKPKVLVLMHKDEGPLEKPKVVELRDLPLDVTHAKAVWIVAGHEHGAFGIDPTKLFSG